MSEYEYAKTLRDGDTHASLYFTYVNIHEALRSLASEDRLTFWLLVYAAEGKELP